MKYYIDIDKRDKYTGFCELDARHYYDEPIKAYTSFMKLCGTSPDHMTLRTYDDGYHGLIAEYFKSDKSPFWFTNYDEYKLFSAELNIEPAREQLEREKAEFLKRFPTFAGHIA
jgi:hypothetical protein